MATGKKGGKRRTRANAVMGIVPESERDWRAESDCDTLLAACKIKKDPKRLAAAQKVAKERLMAAAAIAGESGEE